MTVANCMDPQFRKSLLQAVLTHIPLGMQGAPAQLAAGCQFWIFLANILGVVVAPGPKQPIVCSCEDQCWAPHTLPEDISMTCFLLRECHGVQCSAGLGHAKAQQVSSAWPCSALLRTTLCSLLDHNFKTKALIWITFYL